MAKKKTVLLVDDDPSVLLTLRMVLEKVGYDVTSAKSCGEALGMLGDGRPFDAVITDLNMEKEDIGLEVAKAAATRKPKPAIVVCTASPASAMRCQKTLANSFLGKTLT